MPRDVKKTSVRFIRKNAPYNVNEIAGFPEAIAQRLVDRKRAVYYQPEEAEAEPVEAPEAIEPPEAPEPIVPVHVGGPMYMVGDEKVKGKAKAQALADKLNAAKE